jgi:hypothetical protein
VKLFAVLLCVPILATDASAQLQVTRAYYRAGNASLHLFVTNKGGQPVTLAPPIVNGFDTAALTRDGLQPGPILWYRCRPNPISPGGTADLTITLAEPAGKPAVVELRTAAGKPITATIPCVAEPLRFQAIRFGRDLRSVDLYARWSDASSTDALRTIRMDGRTVARNASPWPAPSCDGLAYTRITLDKPLARGSYHAFEVEAESGLSTAYQIRAIPAEFVIGVYGSASDDNIRDWAAHGCDHYLSFGAVPTDQLDMMRASGLSVGARYIPEPLVDRKAGEVLVCDEDRAQDILQSFAAKPNLLYHHLVDEPDVADYYVGRRLGASAMELIARGDLCQACDRERYTFVQLDNTFRPRNYRVYGEAADVLATHRYSLGSYLASEAGPKTAAKLPFYEDLRDTIARFREATEPKPFFMIPQFFDLGERREGRAPTIGEMRLQCYASIAGGARGLIHYIHSGSGGGHEGAKTPALWDAMTGMHAELKRVGEVVQTGTPAPDAWVKAGSANVRASALLCGDSMAIVLINLAHRSALDGFTARPAREVTVFVRVPPWLDASRLDAVAADGSTTTPLTRSGSELTFVADEIRDARCFLLRPRARR